MTSMGNVGGMVSLLNQGNDDCNRLNNSIVCAHGGSLSGSSISVRGDSNSSLSQRVNGIVETNVSETPVLVVGCHKKLDRLRRGFSEWEQR